MSEFKVAGKTYRAGRIDAMTQMHVARRLAPVLPSLGALMPQADRFRQIAADAQAGVSSLSGEDIEAIAKGVEPLVQAFGSMKDEDVEYVLNAALSRCERQEGTAEKPHWAPIWNAPAKAPMFQDIEAPQMVQIAYHTLQGAFARFLPASPST